MPDQELLNPNDTLNKLSQALIQISRGDPFVALRNELQTRFEAIATRFEAIDKATELQHEDMVRVPTMLDKAITAIRDLVEQKLETRFAEISGQLHAYQRETAERFSGIALQFDERDVRTDQSRAADKIAIDAAFLAQKAAADKSELTTKETIDGLEALFQSSIEPLRAQISALTGRVDRGEGSSRGPTENERILSDLGRRIDAMGARSEGAADTTAKWMPWALLVAALLWGVYQTASPHLSANSPSYSSPTVVSPAVVPVQPK